MKLRIALCLALLSSPALAQPPPQTLTMEQAVEIAMKSQPALRQSRASLEASRGRIEQVEATRRPTLNLSASANIGGGGPSRDIIDPSASSAIGASAQWRITDFGQTAAQLRAAQLSAEASSADVQTDILDVRRDVELTFLEAVARTRLLVVAEATVKSEETHLDQAKRFVAAQAKDPIEVVQAQARAANARASFAQAQSQAAIALANLRAAIGWVDPASTLAVSNNWPVPPDAPPPVLTELVTTARSHRPEIVALDKQVAAAEANIDAARAQRRPVLSANAQSQWSPSWSKEADMNGDHINVPQPSWSIGLSLTWQAYDGGRTAADVRVARANRESALAQRDALLLDLTSQLDSARAQIDANRAATQASTEAVEAARAQLELAEARYAQGLGSQIELADAQTAVTTAEGNLIQSEFQLATAWATLRRSLGGI
ncbi:MAG TPA: TolC family protein [Kofleriaceae bacterium]|nr:TolC family protein [Kofleriaceae bacterium]